MTVSLVYDPVLSRVRITATGLSVTDAFGRTVASGWGTADSGHVWATSGGAASDYSVTGTRGQLSLGSVGVSRFVTTPTISPFDVNVRASIISPVLAAGNSINIMLLARFVDTANYYAFVVVFGTDGNIDLRIDKALGGVFTTLATANNVSVHGTSWNTRFEVVGTTLRGKLWAGSEPPTWNVETTDSALASGSTGLRGVLSSGNTNTLPVVLQVDDFTATPNTVKIERSTDQIRWSTVRGGAALVPAGPISLDDYEFAPDVVNYYRVVGQTASITPTLDGVWLKSIARPFLNRQVEVRDFSTITRPSRSGVFEVVNRSFPVAVTDVRGSRRWTLAVNTRTPEAASGVDLLSASGDILLVHVPTTGRLSATPGGYVAVGDTTEAMPPTADLALRIHSLACTEVAAPGPDVVGATVNWQTVLNTYATWSDVLAAHATWADMLELIGSPTDVIVP